MARRLNQTRIRDTWIILGLCLLASALTRSLFAAETPPHEVLDMFGELLVAACAVGRVYCTAYLGGHKNHSLVTSGPYSVCRNPLYLCSFAGIVGIAVMSNHLVLFVVIPALFFLVYAALVRREEAALNELFGADYAHYCANTPRWWPRAYAFDQPPRLVVSPRLLANAARDGLLWFLALPLFELIEYAQHVGLLQPAFLLY